MPFLMLQYLTMQEVRDMRKEKFNLVLDEHRFDLIIVSLIEMKNKLINEGRFTDAV